MGPRFAVTRLDAWRKMSPGEKYLSSLPWPNQQTLISQSGGGNEVGRTPRKPIGHHWFVSWPSLFFFVESRASRERQLETCWWRAEENWKRGDGGQGGRGEKRGWEEEEEKEDEDGDDEEDKETYSAVWYQMLKWPIFIIGQLISVNTGFGTPCRGSCFWNGNRT